MIYEYRCLRCGFVFDVTKPVKDMDVNEYCPKCDEPSERQFSFKINLMRTGVQHAEYDPAFGRVIKNRQERQELAKRYGWTEVGNEKPESIHKHFEKQREETRTKRWDEI